MRSKTFLLTALAALAAGSLLASPAHKPAASMAKATLLGVEDLKWVDVPNTPVKMATATGDSAKGAHASFMKLPGGFSAPMHSHSADHHAAVLSGTMLMTPEGGMAKKLGPGSWFEFTGNKKHVTTCEAGADCVIFMVSSTAWDMVPAEAPKK